MASAGHKWPIGEVSILDVVKILAVIAPLIVFLVRQDVKIEALVETVARLDETINLLRKEIGNNKHEITLLQISRARDAERWVNVDRRLETIDRNTQPRPQRVLRESGNQD